LNPRRSRHLLVFGAALIVLAADQISKYWVRHNLTPGVPWNPALWLRPILSFTYVTNTGAAFGLFQQLGWFYPLIAISSAFAIIAGILFFYRRLPPDERLILLSLGMQLGGAAGNLADRLAAALQSPTTSPGLLGLPERLSNARVIDFIDLNFWPLHEWPVFNLADSSVVVGVCILALYLLFEQEPPVAPSDTLSSDNEDA
jgi:signal peptidase II